MKKIIFAITIVLLVVCLLGCSKENPLQDTKWLFNSRDAKFYDESGTMNDHNVYWFDHELQEAKITMRDGDIIELEYIRQTYEFTKNRLIESYEPINPDEDITMRVYKYEILSENKIFIKGIQEESVNVILPEELLKGSEIEYRTENDKLLLRIESKATYTDESKIVFDEIYQFY